MRNLLQITCETKRNKETSNVLETVEWKIPSHRFYFIGYKIPARYTHWNHLTKPFLKT